MRQANRRATSASPVIQNPSPITLTPRHPRRAGRPRPGDRGAAGSCVRRRSRRWRARGAETRKQRLTACHNAGLAFVETGTRGTQHVSGSSRSLPPQGRLRKPQVVVHLAAPPGTAGDNGHLPVEAEQLTQHFMRHCHAPSPAQNGRWRTILNTQAYSEGFSVGVSTVRPSRFKDHRRSRSTPSIRTVVISSA
jgi:hypothetical protein